MLRRIALATALAGGLFLPTANAADPPAAPACAGVDVPTTAGTVSAGTVALRCLLQAERRARDLPAYRPTAALDKAAGRHARDMAANDYFSHVSRSGRTLCTRVRATGYLRGSKRRYHLGETLAFGIRADSSPARLMASLLASAPHRRLLLNRDLRDLGVGLADGLPREGDQRPGATVVINLGRRVPATAKRFQGAKSCQGRSG
jgi:uncharacterized protein YkwD